jgi:serine/threonine-protein kinase
MVLADRYRVVRRLGSGGMATVFLCNDEMLDRPVAVKRLHPSDDPGDLRRFRREARVGASLSHPNLVAVYDTIADEEGELIVMEYVEGPTLAEALAQGPLEASRALEILGEVAAGLDHAHSHGVIHRDVKPANVLLAEGGPAKLADLGIASAAHLTQTTTGEMIAGTLAYMAPERLQGDDCGEAGDIYALGAVAFETLSGQRARQATTPAAALAEALKGEPPDLGRSWANAPPAAAAAIQEAMSPDPERRPRRAGDLVERLARAFGADETTPTVALAAPAARRRRKGPLLAIGLVLVLAAIVLAATSGGGGSTGTGKTGAGKAPGPHKTNATPPVTTATVTTTTTTQSEPPPQPKPPHVEHKAPPGQAKKDQQKKQAEQAKEAQKKQAEQAKHQAEQAQKDGHGGDH